MGSYRRRSAWRPPRDYFHTGAAQNDIEHRIWTVYQRRAVRKRDVLGIYLEWLQPRVCAFDYAAARPNTANPVLVQVRDLTVREGTSVIQHETWCSRWPLRLELRFSYITFPFWDLFAVPG
jgi:hypothetical protein